MIIDRISSSSSIIEVPSLNRLHGAVRFPKRKHSGKEDVTMRTVFTTGQVAKICRVAPRTVSKWVDARILPGYRIPGSQDRRIPRKNVEGLIEEHEMPKEWLDEDEATDRILLIGCADELREELSSTLVLKGYVINAAYTEFEAGMQTAAVRPDCVIIDFALGQSEALRIATILRKNDDYQDAVILGVISDDNGPAASDRFPYTEFWKQPFDSALMARRIRTLIGGLKHHN
jgi:excisionase family DNA binding protein